MLRLRTVVIEASRLARTLSDWLDDIATRMPPTPEEVAARMELLKKFRNDAAKMRQRGITRKEILGWIRAGRR
jgi:hypothetical protein